MRVIFHQNPESNTARILLLVTIPSAEADDRQPSIIATQQFLITRIPAAALLRSATPLPESNGRTSRSFDPGASPQPTCGAHEATFLSAWSAKRPVNSVDWLQNLLLDANFVVGTARESSNDYHELL